MRRLAAIGMLVLHLGLFTEAPELLRLPILVEHYVEHRSRVPEMSFLQFLDMHYKTDVAHDATDDELPFKQCCRVVTTPIYTTLAELNFNFQAPVPTEQKEFSSTSNSFVPSTGLDEIFQPPRG